MMKSRPGPLGSSCLTCKRRHKKCDLRRPVCKRCEVGKFTCEGYGHNTRGAARNARPETSHIHSPDVLEAGGSSSHSTTSGSELETGASGSSPLLGGQSEDTTITTSPESFASPNSNTKEVVSGLPNTSNITTTVGKQTSRIEDYLRLFASRSTPDAPANPLTILRKIINIQAQLPYSPTDPMKTFLNSPWFVDYLLEHSDKSTERWYFKPANFIRKRSREDIILRLHNSPITRWVSLVGMSVGEAYSTGNVTQTLLHQTWIGYIEGCLKRELERDLGPLQTQYRRSDWVHVSVMKTWAMHSSGIHQVLRNMASTFLQVVYSEPKFWPSGSDPTYIPLSNILGSDSHELGYFALIDCTYAMASGLPQQIEYDTTMYPQPSSTAVRPSGASSHQWAHSSPIEFQLLLADINACRDKSPAARDWKEIEQWLLTWQSQPLEFEFTKPWMKEAWYAVKESWRFALLAYLYLAVCGASSDDPRIQLCIKQILQVFGTIKKQGASDANLTFFVQYLVIGICARTDAHRKMVRDKLSASNGTQLWVMRASDFVPVLEHLWEGAAAGGRPITWSDYVRSREAGLPIVI